MRLLNTETLEVKQFLTEVPIYAILSHTWEQDEVTFQDIQDLQKAEKKSTLEVEEARKQVQLSKVERIKEKPGWLKIKKACDYVQKYKFKWIWIDTCCIDKSSSAELSEALNSMYQYYENAGVCIAYLSDCRKGPSDVTELLKGLKKCKWFTRGWTLQELIAPRRMVFLDQEWNMIGTRFRMRHVMFEVTSIPAEVFEHGMVKDYSIAQKMSWAASRRTTRAEDMAYCLMGLFGVNMPPIYGEGGAKAFMRLQQEIIKYSDDRSIFAWIGPEGDCRNRGLFARSPSEFLSSGQIHGSDSEELGDKSSFSFGNNGLRIHLSLQDRPDIGDGISFASLHCRDANDSLIGIYLRKDRNRYVRWCPHFPLHRTEEHVGNLQEVVVKESTVPRQRAVAFGMISIEFELDSELALLGNDDRALHRHDDGAPYSIPYFFDGSRSETFRLRTKNGNEFYIPLFNRGDIIPVLLSRHGRVDRNDYRPLRDSRLIYIDDEHALASCFIHRMGDSTRRVVEINYIPSSSPKFDYCRQLEKFQCTSRVLSSPALNFTLDVRSHFLNLNSSSSIYPSDFHWEQDASEVGRTYQSILYPSDQCDIHFVFGYVDLFNKCFFITSGLRTDSERRIFWIDVCVPDDELQISELWESYQPSGSRYGRRHQNRSTATLNDRSFTFTVEEKKVLEPPWYNVVITDSEERCELEYPFGGETEVGEGGRIDSRCRRLSDMFVVFS